MKHYSGVLYIMEIYPCCWAILMSFGLSLVSAGKSGVLKKKCVCSKEGWVCNRFPKNTLAALLGTIGHCGAAVNSTD